MGILEQTSNFQNCIKKTNKIPEYAKDFKNEFLFLRGINNLKLAENIKNYIEEVIMRLKIKNKIHHEENWGKIIIYEMILNLANFIIEYFNDATEDRLKIVDWYFIDFIINKDKIIVRGFFYEHGLFLEDKVLSEGLLELESSLMKVKVINNLLIF